MLFDAYIMVDWSAAAKPTRGADSIWISIFERRDGRLLETKLENPRTRHDATLMLLDVFSDMQARGIKALAGFDFAFGYPKGFGEEMGYTGEAWKKTWRMIARQIEDNPDNANNRFVVASRLNAKFTGKKGPFWGCPPAEKTPILSDKKPKDAPFISRTRICETRIKGIKPVWQLYYTGSVGSQTLMGVKRLNELVNHPWIMDGIKVWPFETGLRALAREDLSALTFVEIYPSQIPARGDDQLPKDAYQVKNLCQRYADLDEKGVLGGLFAGGSDLTPDEIKTIETEEGWVLGVGKADKVQAYEWLESYLRKPDEIYQKSEEMIATEINVSQFPKEMQDVTVRMIHSCGDVSLGSDIYFSDHACAEGRAALKEGKPVFVDVEMVAHGIIRKRLPAENDVICTLNSDQTPNLAAELDTTRSAAALELWGDQLEGAVVVIGNAPTALFHLIQGILDGRFKKPALIIGCPVGFVGAAESKETLMALANQLGVDYICTKGKRGGSAIAAAALNALAKEGISQ